MLNPNSYAIITAKNQWGIQTDRYLQVGTLEPFGILIGTSEPLEPFHGTLSWNFETFRNLTFAWNPLLEPSLGTLTWNSYLEPPNLLEPWNFGTSWIPYLEPWNLLDPFTWNPYLEPRNLAGGLPQSAPGPSLAETPKLSAVGEL